MKRLALLFCNEHIMLGVILLNTLLMFLGGFWPDNQWFSLADSAFTIIFLIEAAVKIGSSGWRSYWADGWNRFDFIVLLIALPSLSSLFMEQSPGTSAVLALRSMRLFKSFRLFRFVPNIRKLLKGIRLASRATMLVFVAVAIFLFIFAILSTAIFGQAAPQYFGNPGLSIYSIFRLFTVEGWYELPEAVAAGSTQLFGAFARVYFSVLLFVGGIIGMSLINSLFVDAMTEDNNDQVLAKLDDLEQQIRDLKK